MNAFLWSRLDGDGLEYCDFHFEPATLLNGQAVVHFDGRPMAISYRLECYHDGSTKSVNLSCRMNGVQKDMTIHRTEDEQWICDGVEMEAFRGLKDVDLGFTPATNTLPIRRFQLAEGESRELTAVWLRFPELVLSPLTQRYTRIAPKIYTYESIVSGYKAQIHVNSDGVVTEYEDAWKLV